jgi:short-subunit dehydrogenase
VQALCPGFTYSEFHDVAQMDRGQIPGPLWMQAEDVVCESLQGLREDRWMVIPGTVYKGMALLLKLPFVHAAVRRARSRVR